MEQEAVDAVASDLSISAGAYFTPGRVFCMMTGKGTFSA